MENDTENRPPVAAPTWCAYEKKTILTEIALKKVACMEKELRQMNADYLKIKHTTDMILMKNEPVGSAVKVVRFLHKSRVSGTLFACSK